MGFWTKRIVIILFVVVGAFLAIRFMPGPALDENGVPVERRSIETNMADFYEEFGMVSDERINEKLGENVIELTLPEEPLGLLIKTRSRSVQRSNEAFNWRGAYKVRAFSVESSLKENTYEHVKKEGLELVWHLNQDFIISNRFLSENTVVGMLNEIAGAIDTNFIGDVRVYYCDKQRVMVITDQEDSALDTGCGLVKRY